MQELNIKFSKKNNFRNNDDECELQAIIISIKKLIIGFPLKEK